jgi:hypothetical protein
MLDFPTFCLPSAFLFFLNPNRRRRTLPATGAASLPPRRRPYSLSCHCSGQHRRHATIRPMLSRGHSAHVVPMSPCFLGHRRRFSATAPACRRAIVRDSAMHSSLVPCCCAPSATFAEQRAPCCRAPPRVVSCPSPAPPPSCLRSVEGKKLTQMYVCLRVQCRSYTLIHV